jgi:ABC-type transport system involved in multi-copper enzyme maturation permease subunit
LSVYLLAGSIFAFSLGVGSIGKRIESRTIASQLTKPVSRMQLYTLEVITNGIFLVVSSVVLCAISLVLFNTLLQNQSSVSTTYFVSLFLGSGLLFIAFAVLGQLVGVILNGGRSVLVGAAVVVVSWFVNSLAPLVHMPSVVQKFSLFHYFDVTLLRTHYDIALGLTLQLLVIILVVFIAGRQVFNNKNIYI